MRYMCIANNQNRHNAVYLKTDIRIMRADNRRKDFGNAMGYERGGNGDFRNGCTYGCVVFDKYLHYIKGDGIKWGHI